MLVDLDTLDITETSPVTPINRPFGSLNSVDIQHVNALRLDSALKYHFNEEKQMVSFYAAILKPNAKILSEKGLALVIRYSLAEGIESVKRQFGIESIAFAISYMLFTLTLLVLYHRYYKQPLENITRSLQLFSTEPKKVDPRVKGRGNFVRCRIPSCL